MAKGFVMEKVTDALKVAPNNYKVLLESDRVRVLELTLKPGGKIAMHSHPDVVAYALEDTRHRFILPDGKTEDVQLKKGEVMWSEAFSHGAENIGTTNVHLVIVELKK